VADAADLGLRASDAVAQFVLDGDQSFCAVDALAGFLCLLENLGSDSRLCNEGFNAMQHFTCYILGQHVLSEHLACRCKSAGELKTNEAQPDTLAKDISQAGSKHVLRDMKVYPYTHPDAPADKSRRH
jgi:hypothetical protein